MLLISEAVGIPASPAMTYIRKKRQEVRHTSFSLLTATDCSKWGKIQFYAHFDADNNINLTAQRGKHFQAHFDADSINCCDLLRKKKERGERERGKEIRRGKRDRTDLVSLIWLAISALGCCPKASGWSPVGRCSIYSYTEARENKTWR